MVPRTQTEEAVAAIWRQVLRSDAIDCAEDFFRLGGHSLLAAQVVSRLRDVFQIELPLPMLVRTIDTVQALASYVDRRALARAKRSCEAMPAIEPQALVGTGAALSFSQERMWLIHELAPKTIRAYIPCPISRVQLCGQLDHQCDGAGDRRRALSA